MHGLLYVLAREVYVDLEKVRTVVDAVLESQVEDSLGVGQGKLWGAFDDALELLGGKSLREAGEHAQVALSQLQYVQPSIDIFDIEIQFEIVQALEELWRPVLDSPCQSVIRAEFWPSPPARAGS